MAENYQEFVDLAEELIQEFGRSLLFGPFPSTLDPSKPWRGPATPIIVPGDLTPYTATGVVVDFDLEQEGVLRGDQNCYTRMPPATSVVPQWTTVTDSLNGTMWRIIGATPIGPGGTVVLYQLHLRQ